MSEVKLLNPEALEELVTSRKVFLQSPDPGLGAFDPAADQWSYEIGQAFDSLVLADRLLPQMAQALGKAYGAMCCVHPAGQFEPDAWHDLIEQMNGLLEAYRAAQGTAEDGASSAREASAAAAAEEPTP